MPRKMTKKLNGKFTIAKMRDIVAECADNLTVAIAEQNPNVDGFALETDLRSLVQKHGSGETPPAATDVTASDARPEYSLAGDLLVLAFQAAQNGDWRSAFRTFASAVEAEDETVQNTVPFQAIDCQSAEAGRVRAVHVIPSGEVHAAVEPPPDTAQNTLPFQATANQAAAEGRTAACHVTPLSVE